MTSKINYLYHASAGEQGPIVAAAPLPCQGARHTPLTLDTVVIIIDRFMFSVSFGTLYECSEYSHMIRNRLALLYYLSVAQPSGLGFFVS